jgi:PAS domain S-box-containing protein
MRIGELARRTGIEAGTLRAWERRFGLLDPTRTKGGQRQYSEADVATVLSVRRLLAEGLTLSAAIERVAGADGAMPPGEAETLMLRQIVQNLTLGIVVARDGRTIFANRRMAQMVRCSVEDLLATNLLAFIPEEDLTPARESMADLRQGIAFLFDRRILRADGTTFDAEAHVRPLFDRAGRYEGSVAIVSDVTDRKAAETEHRFRAALLDAIGEAVTASDNDGVITYANNAAAALTGWPVEEFVGRHIDSFPTASPSSLKELEAIRARVRDGERFSGEVPLVRKDGSTSSCQLTSTPVFGADGELVGRINVMHDVTDERKHDEEIHIRDLRASAVAVLGRRAAATDRGSADEDLMYEIVEATRRLVGADRARVAEVDGQGKLSVRAAAPEGEPVAIPAGGGSLAGYSMLAGTVVVVEDVARERRFDTTSLAPETRSAIAAPVFGPKGPCGALVAERAAVSSFDQSAVDFMQSIVNVVAAALK